MGKTSIIHRFVDEKFTQEYIPTLGFEISIKELEIEEQSIILSIWEMGAQRSFDLMRTRHYQGAHGFLMVFDLSVRKSLQDLDHWIGDIQKTCPRAAILIVGNKSDLSYRFVTEQEVIEKINSYGAIDSVLVSAKTGAGITQAFTLIGQSILQRLEDDELKQKNLYV